MTYNNPLSAVDMWLYTAVAIAAAVAYYLSVSTYDKWEKLNVPYVRPVPLFGNIFNVIVGRDHALDFYNKMYRKFDGRKYAGLFYMRTPCLMVRDPEMISEVLIKDFAYFTDRGIDTDFEVNPMSNHLFRMENPRWKTIRSKLSAAFTSGKLKLMYAQIKECGEKLIKNVDNSLIASGDGIEVTNVMEKYSTDIIGTCAFGLELNTIDDDESAFRKYGKMVFAMSVSSFFIEIICWLITPALLKVIRLKILPDEVTDFFRTTFKETITYREENNIVRNDFVNVLMQARKDLVLNPNLPEHEKFTESQIIANAFVMFTAGFETTSSAIAFCLYELALNKSIQDKLRQEIQLKIFENDEKINNEFLNDLNYLDMIILETLRKYPPAIILFRKATQTYRLSSSRLIIEKGQKIVIPVYALHYDTKYYTDPEMFVPERFSVEEKAKRPSGTYLPFGDGPRMCIAKRFAELEIKLALVKVLTKFEVLPCEKTDIPLRFRKMRLLLTSKNGIWLKFKAIV